MFDCICALPYGTVVKYSTATVDSQIRIRFETIFNLFKAQWFSGKKKEEAKVCTDLNLFSTNPATYQLDIVMEAATMRTRRNDVTPCQSSINGVP